MKSKKQVLMLFLSSFCVFVPIHAMKKTGMKRSTKRQNLALIGKIAKEFHKNGKHLDQANPQEIQTLLETMDGMEKNLNDMTHYYRETILKKK